MPPRLTLDQERAQSTYQAVRVVVESASPKAAGKYKSLAKNLPVMLLKMGIGQTLAFLASNRKGDDSAEARLIAQLAQWLPARIGMSTPPGADADWLLGQLINGDRDTWHAATREAVSYSTWLKRFAEALLPDPPAGD